MTEIVKKKRGRKPKNHNIVTTEGPVSTEGPVTTAGPVTTVGTTVGTTEENKPKKRGRKQKNPIPEVVEEPPIVKLPKKRGRKPKEPVVELKETILTEEPIILHLPLKNINTNEILIPKPFIDMDKFNSKYKDLNNNETPNLETSITEVNVINKFNELCSEYSNVIERDKVFPIFLEFIEYNKKKKWPDSTNIDCLWCCHEFDTFPFGIPIKKYEETYYMFGNFCSAECSSAYNFDNNNSSESFERYSLINYLYSNDKEIKVAGPRLSLKKFGGQLSIKEFRNNNNIYSKNYKLLLPPMISLIPLVEELNLIDNKISFDNNDNLFNLDDSELKLKRSKPLPESYNTLENCMNLKLV